MVKKNHLLEIMFSLFRWFFLLLSTALFFYYDYLEPFKYNVRAFVLLLIFGIVYMGIAEVVLHRSCVQSKAYSFITKAGVLFDYVAFIALIYLTGSGSSPLFPVAYLIILHASVYWGLKGGIVTSTSFVAGYTILLIMDDYSFQQVELFHYGIKIVFLIVFGFIGGSIVSQERKHLTEKVFYEDLSKKDYLTNLYNHRSFQEYLRSAINMKKKFCLALADIDHFKEVNDKYGHITGDMVLNKIGSILNEELDGVGMGFRYGGEEFAMIIFKKDEEAYHTLENIRTLLGNHLFETERGKFNVTMSIGAVNFKGQEPLEIIRKADELLYAAKSEGRDRIIRDKNMQEVI